MLTLRLNCAAVIEISRNLGAQNEHKSRNAFTSLADRYLS